MTDSKNKRKILVVDDEKPLARALELKLNKAGFEAKVAFDGQDGYELIKKEKFDLIILDLVMPKMSGFEVMEKIKSLKINAPIVILSNLSQKEDEEKARRKGAKHFFIKSDVPISDIVEKIQSEFKK